MKKILCGLLTIISTLALITLGLSLNVEKTIVDTMDTIVKTEVTNNLVDYLSENTGVEKEKITEGINKVMDNNEEIKNTINDYFDKIMNIMLDEETANIDLAKEVENIIDNSEPILKDYGITITEKDKNDILASVSNTEVNDSLNEAIQEFKNDMPKEVKSAIEIFNFVRSTTFKIILIATIIVSLLLIALLKKSYYKWLPNFGFASIITGIIMGILLPTATDLILTESNVTLNISGFKNYGYILLVLGLIAYIIRFIIPKFTLKESSDIEA